VSTTGGLTVRRPRAEDVPAVLDLCIAADTAVIGESDWTEDDLREEFADTDLERNAWIVELGGRLAGFTSLNVRGGRLIADGYVHPELHGRGVGSELVRLTEERAAELEPDVPPGERVYLQNATLNVDPRSTAFYDARGYAPVRHFWKMVAELDGPPEVPEVPGVTIRPYRHPDELRALYEADEEAFADHWEHLGRSYEEWVARHVERERFDPTLWWVAEVEDRELAGVARCDWKRGGDWGWVEGLAVRRAYRRRGIADALLKTAFAEFHRRGERRVALGVDAQSPTGATRVYEKAGMRIYWEAVVYEKELRPA
jgi:mycothiol synthase